MSRIRSVHPGLFTDDKFASCSLAAQVLFIGIWTECDDHGAFEWNPVKLKMRLLPVHNVDVAALLSELASHDLIREYTNTTRHLGLVRNFTLFQRPKKPKFVHSIPSEYHTYIGLTASSTEPKPPEPIPVPKKGELGPQMEEGGGREESKKASVTKVTGVPRTPSSEEKILFDRGKAVLGKGSGGLITKLLKAKDGSFSQALAAIELAASKQNPAEYIGAVLRAPAGATVNADGTFSRWAI